MEFGCSEGLRRVGEASFSVETLEDSICVVIPYNSIIEGMNKSEQMKIIFNKYIQKIFVNMERRERALLMESAMERYMEFKREYSSIADRISQAYIASYIGIRLSSLSRIKKSMKIK